MNAVSADQIVQRNEISHMSEANADTSLDSPVPTDADPIKLVLEDQSIKYPVSPFVSYLRAGNGALLTLLLFAFFFLVHGVRIGSGKSTMITFKTTIDYSWTSTLHLDYWLSQWFSKTPDTNQTKLVDGQNVTVLVPGKYAAISNELFVGAYGGSVGVFTAGVLLRGLLFSKTSLIKSVDLHQKMFKSIIYAQMSFFDSTPLGRILNAFARHQYATDAQLSDALMQLLQYTPLCLGAMILCSCVMYQTVGVFAASFVVAALILLYVGNTEGKLRDHEALSKSPIFGHLTATLEGLFSIRAYECQNRFVQLNIEKIDENHKYQFAVMEGNQIFSGFWLGFSDRASLSP